MMKLYAVRDVKADSFGAPMSIATEGLARRSFLEACLNPQSDLNKYPSDYMLFEVGSYEPNTGTITPCHPAPKFIISASAAIQESRTPEVKEIVNQEAN